WVNQYTLQILTIHIQITSTSDHFPGDRGISLPPRCCRCNIDIVATALLTGEVIPHPNKLTGRGESKWRCTGGRPTFSPTFKQQQSSPTPMITGFSLFPTPSNHVSFHCTTVVTWTCN